MDSPPVNAEFLRTLKQRFGKTEEFCQFEREFYSQREEVGMLRQTVDTLRSSVAKLQEEKRVLQLQLVSEKASRDEDGKNAMTDREKHVMQLNTQIHSIKCEAETWKRKAGATMKESDWLKEQLKALELEKAEAFRKIEDSSRLTSGVEQYRQKIEAYVKRQKDGMVEMQRRLTDLDAARSAYAELSEGTEKKVKCMAVHLKNMENARAAAEARIFELEKDLIETKGQLVQNSSELERSHGLQTKTEQLVNKLLVENKDLHEGFGLLCNSRRADDCDTGGFANTLDRLPELHEEIMKEVGELSL